jgi:glycosyltransferase involved in cell wall biosynthesis
MQERFNERKEKHRLRTFANVLSTYLRIRQEGRLSTGEFIQKYGGAIRSAFSTSIEEGAVPVLVCAWNEAEDLPKLLRALSLSTVPVKPIVVDNNSTDGTGDLAKDLGAAVIFEKQQGIMHALISGFRRLDGNPNIQEFLLTDADSYPVPTWASGMKKSGNQIDNTSGGIIYGQVVYHGKLIRDTAHNVSEWLGDLISHGNNNVIARGANGFIKFGEKRAIANQLANELNPNIILNSDMYVRDSVRNAGGTVKKSFSPDTWVFSDGGRYPSFLSLFKVPPYGNSKEDLYREWINNNPKGEIYRSRDKL